MEDVKKNILNKINKVSIDFYYVLFLQNFKSLLFANTYWI